jgi:hypothetical protein
MCTLTLVTQNDGYLLAMNRDEKIARGAGTNPEAHEFNGTRALYPGDGTGGTWIAANEHGIALALLNWNVPTPSLAASRQPQSRGQLIPALADARSMAELLAALDVLDLERMLPFRLTGVFASEQVVQEWRWNSTNLSFEAHPWESRHWFSSSLSDEEALRLRGATCQIFRNEHDAGSSRWLRRLHASHTDGPLSVCVHRDDVRTLSYTEICCTSSEIEVEHFIGSPCTMKQGHSAAMQRAAAVALSAPAQPSLSNGSR